MSSYFNEILDLLLDNSLSVFCGAGATADATRSEWQHIFTQQTQEYYKNKYSDDLYFLADLEKRYYNTDNFFTDIVSKIDSLKNVKSKHIDAVVKLNLNQIWTTNFDEIIEESIKSTHGFTPVVIKNSNDILTQDINGKYVVYKVNGSITDNDSMVLTKSDFHSYFRKQRVLFEILKRQLVLNSFLFIGYSFKDELVLNALREIKDVFPSQGKTHYRFVKRAIAQEQQDFQKYEARYFEDQYNIKSIYIDSYDDIDYYLNKLYQNFCERNVFISGSYRNIDNEHRLYIEEIIDKIIFNLYKNRFNVYSGNGRGVGEIILARADKYSIYFPKCKFVNRPFIFSGDTKAEKSQKNTKIIRDCKTNIIICGQDESLNTSENVIEQSNMFLDKNNLVIPLPTTKYAAEQIFFSNKFRQSLFYQNHKDTYNKLNISDTDELARIITNFILQIYKPE